MTDVYRNPETTPADEHVEIRYTDPEWRGNRMDVAGPGGKTTNLEHNEKGILERGLFEAMSVFKQAELGSSHDGHAQGIYADVEVPRYAD